MMTHQSRVINNIPIDAIRRRVLDRLFRRVGQALEAARSIVDHAEQENITRRTRTLAPDMQVVRVPSIGPFLRIVIDAVQEEMVEEPDVLHNGRIEVVINLKVKEERLPLVSEPMGHIVPETLDTSVIDAPAVVYMAGQN
jgi:hypothetical protein